MLITSLLIALAGNLVDLDEDKVCISLKGIYQDQCCPNAPTAVPLSQECPFLMGPAEGIYTVKTIQSSAFKGEMNNHIASPLSWLLLLAEIATIPLTGGKYPIDIDGSYPEGSDGKHNVDEYHLDITPFGNNTDSKSMYVASNVYAGTEHDGPNAYGQSNSRLNISLALLDGTGSAKGWVEIGTDCDYHHNSPECTDPLALPDPATPSTYPIPGAPVWAIGLDFPQFQISCVDPALTLHEMDRYLFKNILSAACGPCFGKPGFGYGDFNVFCTDLVWSKTDGTARSIVSLDGKFSHPRSFDGPKMTSIQAYRLTNDKLRIYRTIVPSVIQSQPCQSDPSKCEPNTNNTAFIIETLTVTFGA